MASPLPPEVGFLGLPVETDLAALEADVAVLGVPGAVAYDRPGAAAGCAEAPAAIRRASLRFGRFLDHHDFDFGGPLLAGGRLRIVDCGDVPVGSEPATAAVRAILERGTVPIVLGGDDSVPIPILRAYEGRAALTVVQVDAHLDFRDEVQGEREGYSSPMRRASEMPWVERTVQVGLRGSGSARPSDVADALAAGNLLVTAAEVRARGIGPAVLDRLPPGAACFVTLDCDGLDPSVMPAVSAPLPGGLGYDEAAALLVGLTRRCRVVGMDLTELVPALDVNGLSSVAATRLILTLIGGLARSGAVDAG